MDEIKEPNDEIDIYKLVFSGSNKKEFNFNTFRMPLNFLSAIYNGEISLKESEIPQRKIEKKIGELKFDYRPKNKKEKEEINKVLMQADDLFEYRYKVFDALKDGTFLSEHLKKSDDAAYDYVLKDVHDFIQEIKSMEEKTNLSLSVDFFESSSPANYVIKLFNTSPDENKKIVAEIKDRLSDLKDRIKEMSEKEKNFHLVSKVDKEKSEPKSEESIAKECI